MHQLDGMVHTVLKKNEAVKHFRIHPFSSGSLISIILGGTVSCVLIRKSIPGWLSKIESVREQSCKKVVELSLSALATESVCYLVTAASHLVKSPSPVSGQMLCEYLLNVNWQK